MISGTDRPRRHPWYRAAADRDAVLFDYGGQVVRVTGPGAGSLLSALLPYLDGRHSVEEIEQHLADWETPAVRQAISVLVSNGVATIEPDQGPATEDEHLLAILLGTPDARAAMGDAGVGVVGTGRLADAVAGLCERSDIGRLERVAWSGAPREPCDLVIAAPDGTDLPYLGAWNLLMLERRQVWLPVVPFDGVLAAVGPLVIPRETACYACTRIRRRSMLEDPDLAELYEDRPAYLPMGPAVTSLAAGLAVHLVLRWVIRRDPRIPGMLFALSLSPHPEIRGHEVLPVPRCPACRAGRDHRPSPWQPPDLSPGGSSI
jgi:bacteriocin biosynthesis cyclodehydratase domain-containing protein